MTKLNFYKVNFKIEKNPLIDNLDAYLNTIENSEHVEFNIQYIKHDLNISVKIPGDQSSVKNFPYNYATIQNDDEKKFYYYVMNTVWIARGTIGVVLSLDTVNTLAINNNLIPENFTDETVIKREHRDRFEDTPIYNHTYLRRIDRENEGIDLIKDKKGDYVARDNEFGLEDWFLMFKTRENLTPDNPNNPLGIYLIPEKQCEVNRPSPNSHVFTVNDFQVGFNYYFLGIDNPNGSLEIPTPPDRTTYTLGQARPGHSGYSLSHVAMRTYTDNNKIYFTLFWRNNSNPNDVDIESKQVDNVLFNKGKMMRYGDYDWRVNDSQQTIAENSQFIQPVNAHEETTLLKNIGSVDRTDSRIIKLFRLPYCPIDMRSLGYGVVSIPKTWSIKEDFLKYNGYDLPKLKRTDAFDIELGTDLEIPLNNITDKDEKNIKYESKLWHSDFKNLKLVYVNDGKDVKLEDVKLYNEPDPIITVDYQATNTANSDMLFTINYDDIGTYLSNDDYDKYLLSTPNNEETILSSDFLNYIRNGYNYDKTGQKLAIQQEKANAMIRVAEAGIRAGQTHYNIDFDYTDDKGSKIGEVSEALWGKYNKNHGTASMEDWMSKNWTKILRKATPGNGIISQLVIGAGASAVDALANIYFTSENQKNQMASKQAQLQAQAVGILGGTSVDLMKEMTDNKVHIFDYQIRDEWKQNIYDYFDKFGYSHSYTEVPNVSSRIWYNFIQCEAKMKPEDTHAVPEEWLDDLKTRYDIGVSVFHQRNNEWNFDQKYENWETKLLA